MITNQLEYYNEIADISRDTWREVLEESNGDKDQASDLMQARVLDIIDGHQWVIYTHYHDQVLRYSTNSEAYLDVYDNDALGDLVRDKGVDALNMAMAYFAMQADVLDHFYEFLATN